MSGTPPLSDHAQSALRPVVGAVVHPGIRPRRGATIGHVDIEVRPRIPFSVLISVYKNDDPRFFDEALESVTTRQTLSPDEVVLVVDGPVSDALNAVIAKWKRHKAPNIKVIRSELNVGLAKALNLGLSHCSYEYVARMDSDDVSLPQRFEKEIEYLSRHPDVALLGSWYQQYDSNMQTLLTDRKVPTEMTGIVPYSKTRTPFNHVTAVFKKSAVISVGGYPDIKGYLEDWWIGLRLLKNGYQMANLPEYLVDVRGDREFIGRRGGWKYLKCELANLQAMHQQELLSTFDLLKNLSLRTLVRLLPLPARTLIYKAIRKV